MVKILINILINIFNATKISILIKILFKVPETPTYFCPTFAWNESINNNKYKQQIIAIITCYQIIS